MLKFLLYGLLILRINGHAKAQSEVDFMKMAELVVQVVDDQEKPISGATVYPYAMRGAEGGGHGFWNEKLIGPPKTEISAETGKAIIGYPVHIGSDTDPLTTSLVTFLVRHTDFVQQVVHFDLGPEVAKVTLKAGCEVQLSAVDPNGQPIPEFGVLMAGPLAPSYWSDDGQGGRRTRSASDGAWQTMIVKPQSDGPTLFSGVLPLRVQPDQDVKIRNVKLLPGTKLQGVLSDNVPRPVKNGYIVAVSAPKPAENSYADKDPSITWHDWTEINEDGTFELASIPRGGDLQLIGLCDGWLSRTNFPDAQAFFIMGQLFHLDKDKPQIEVSLEMEATGQLELTVQKPDGSPLKEGEISSWPNQLYMKGGSTLLGQRYRSLPGVEQQLLPADQQSRPARDDQRTLPYQGQVVDGKVTLTGLPVGRAYSMVLQHPQLVLQSDGQDSEVGFKLDSPEPKAMTVKTTLPKIAPADKE